MLAVAPRLGGFAFMRTLFLMVATGLWLTGGTLLAFEAIGTIQNIDVERGVLRIHANGRERTVTIARDLQVLGTNGQPLADGLLSRELKPGIEATFSIDRTDREPILQAIRLGRRGTVGTAGMSGKSSVGLKPLTEMTAEERYKGEDGGLYGGGRNEPPPGHLAAALKQTGRIAPLDAEGTPAQDGQIGLISISMSNATQEYSLFKQLADSDPLKSPRVAIVDCAQGGQAMAEWVNPQARAWEEAERRLERAGVSAQQVQVIWVKLANKGPRGDLAEHGRKLQKDTLAVLQNAKACFPNLRVAYLGSRIYGGYANSPLNPEPYAYEGAFAVRWLIQDQAQGDPDLLYDDAGGAAKAPLLLWGPYFWADGTTPRTSDGLVWERADLGGDGTHPSGSGRRKVAEALLTFFKNDALAYRWFTGKPDLPASK